MGAFRFNLLEGARPEEDDTFFGRTRGPSAITSEILNEALGTPVGPEGLDADALQADGAADEDQGEGFFDRVSLLNRIGNALVAAASNNPGQTAAQIMAQQTRIEENKRREKVEESRRQEDIAIRERERQEEFERREASLLAAFNREFGATTARDNARFAHEIAQSTIDHSRAVELQGARLEAQKEQNSADFMQAVSLAHLQNKFAQLRDDRRLKAELGQAITIENMRLKALGLKMNQQQSLKLWEDSQFKTVMVKDGLTSKAMQVERTPWERNQWYNQQQKLLNDAQGIEQPEHFASLGIVGGKEFVNIANDAMKQLSPLGQNILKTAIEGFQSGDGETVLSAAQLANSPAAAGLNPAERNLLNQVMPALRTTMGEGAVWEGQLDSRAEFQFDPLTAPVNRSFAGPQSGDGLTSTQRALRDTLQNIRRR